MRTGPPGPESPAESRRPRESPLARQSASPQRGPAICSPSLRSSRDLREAAAARSAGRDPPPRLHPRPAQSTSQSAKGEVRAGRPHPRTVWWRGWPRPTWIRWRGPWRPRVQRPRPVQCWRHSQTQGKRQWRPPLCLRSPGIHGSGSPQWHPCRPPRPDRPDRGDRRCDRNRRTCCRSFARPPPHPCRRNKHPS